MAPYRAEWGWRQGLRGLAAGFTALNLVACASAPKPAVTALPRPNVAYSGPLEPAGTSRAQLQNLILDLASAWANCDADLMAATLASDVDFSYPTTRIKGRAGALENLRGFCAEASQVSLFFPQDAFYIDARHGRVAAELQFRATVKGQRQVVNDVWIATVRAGKIVVIKEYLDGRVRHLQAQGVLSLEEGAPFLTPWPPALKPLPQTLPVPTPPPTGDRVAP